MSRCLTDVVHFKINGFHQPSPGWCVGAVGYVIFFINGGKYGKICNIFSPRFYALSFHEIGVAPAKTFRENGPISREILAGWERDLAYGTHHLFLYTVVYLLVRGNIAISQTPQHKLYNWRIFGIFEKVKISTFQYIFLKFFRMQNVPQGILYKSQQHLNHNPHGKCVHFSKYGRVVKRCRHTLPRLLSATGLYSSTSKSCRICGLLSSIIQVVHS